MNRGARLWGMASALACALVSQRAAAQDIAGGGVASTSGDVAAEIASLEAALARDDVALSTPDCASACSALESMRRAARRLCQLDPGPRCSGARAKVDAADERVSASCGACARDPQQADRAPAPDHASEHLTEPPRGGGCAGCGVGDRGAAPGEIALVLGAALALARRRRRER